MSAMRDQHVDAETLAEFIDRVLPAAEQQDVERHLAGCAECRSVLLDAVAFLESDRPVAAAPQPAVIARRPARWPLRLGLGLAAAAVLLLAVRVVFWDAGGSDRPELQELVTAFAAEPTRATDGRLTGGFGYAPAPAVNRGGAGAGSASADRSPQVRIAIAGIERAATGQATPGQHAALGVAKLADGDLAAAVAGLERATGEQPADARFWSDLSAAYLAAGRRSRDAARSAQALAAADRALQIDPALPEALFNRALALEESGDVAAAVAAWSRVRDAEGDSGWGREAQEHLRRLSAR